MPIYEFYCRDCNTVYKFFSRTVNTEKVPVCPDCKGPSLKRRMSTFATVSAGEKKEGGLPELPDIDEGKMEKALSMLAQEAGGMDEDDPKQAARLMRKLTETTGMKMGDGMEEAISRLEKGEDPEQVEKEMGDLIDTENPFASGESRKSAKRQVPRVDEKLYEL